MCGIVGGQLAEVDLTTIAHRGPDDAQVVTCGPWLLGHTRLAVQDVTSESRQPMQRGAVTLTFNGELWAPHELRATYMLDCTTTGDTEVFALLLDRFSEDALRYVRGMFAVAWVASDNVLRIARDAYGEVPLHYGFTTDNRFVYGSEIAAVLAHGAHPTTIRWVNPGGIIRVYPDSRIEYDRWHHSPAYGETDDIGALLRQGVRDRLTADVPVGLLVSGGLDSSLIAALAARPDLPAYTAVHHAKSSDHRAARKLAERLGLQLIEVRVPSPTADDLADVVRIIEQPHKAQVEIAWACLHLARRLQKDGIRVVLSGEGSDELLGSYGMSYHGIKQYGWRGYRERTFIGQHRKNFARTNKVFMRYGVEARLPFLHEPFIARILDATQDEVTAHRRHPKAIIAQVAEPLIGADLAWRTKAAFQTDARLDQAAAKAVTDPTRFYRQAFSETFGGVTA